jgi:hypothetical protein
LALGIGRFPARFEVDRRKPNGLWVNESSPITCLIAKYLAKSDLVFRADVVEDLLESRL